MLPYRHRVAYARAYISAVANTHVLYQVVGSAWRMVRAGARLATLNDEGLRALGVDDINFKIEMI